MTLRGRHRQHSDGHIRMAPLRAQCVGHSSQADGSGATFAKGNPKRAAWRDKLKPDGALMEELAPDSSMYYITCALAELMDTGRAHKGPRLAPCLRPAPQVRCPVGDT